MARRCLLRSSSAWLLLTTSATTPASWVSGPPRVIPPPAGVLSVTVPRPPPRPQALDEPTTNIDSHNKAGLARALAGIIESRGSKSLQLIVITHDEEFVTEMGRALQGGGGSASKGQLGTYYRVSRNQVRAGVFHSRIDLQEFA